MAHFQPKGGAHEHDVETHYSGPGEAGFDVLDEIDSTEESLAWFQDMTARMAKEGPPPVSFQSFLGTEFPQMARNQVQNLADRRIRTVAYICRA